MISRDLVERKMSNLLQRDIKFILNSKVIRTGKLLIFNVKDFYACFTLSYGSDKKIYELPFPFAINIHNDGVEFDYTLDTLSGGNTALLYRLKVLTKVKKNKLFNNKLKIQYKA